MLQYASTGHYAGIHIPQCNAAVTTTTTQQTMADSDTVVTRANLTSTGISIIIWYNVNIMQSSTTTWLNEFTCGLHLLLCVFFLDAYQGCIIRLLLLDALKEYNCRLPQVTTVTLLQSNWQEAHRKRVTSALNSASEKMHTTVIHSKVCWTIVHILSM